MFDPGWLIPGETTTGGSHNPLGFTTTVEKPSAMSSSSSSMVDRSDGDRKLTESPTPFSEAQCDYEVIPKTHNNRTLVLCFDGTGDKFDSDVRKLAIDTLLSPTTTSLPRHDRTPTSSSSYRC